MVDLGNTDTMNSTGPWTVEEDMLLVNYVAAHGEGRWNALARCAGLRRTGKSCRLRWLNYLRPALRRGNITPQEQLLIRELHSRWGNRWSKIAQHLPGRTDNEIKNYWRTRLQKHARQLNCDVMVDLGNSDTIVRHPLQMLLFAGDRKNGGFICDKSKANLIVAGWTESPSTGIIPIFIVHSANAKGDHIRKNICTLSRAPIFIVHSANAKGNYIRKNICTLSRAIDHHREIVVILDSQAQASCTGNFTVLSKLEALSQNIVLVAANGEEMPTFMSGSVRSGSFVLDDVYFCPEVGEDRIIVSGSVLDNLGYHYGFGGGQCCVEDRTGRIVGEGRLIDGNYVMDYLRIPRDRTPEIEQPTLVSSVWNTFCSALCRLGLNPRGH